jgi:hypothetical protein
VYRASASFARDSARPGRARFMSATLATSSARAVAGRVRAGLHQGQLGQLGGPS